MIGRRITPWQCWLLGAIAVGTPVLAHFAEATWLVAVAGGALFVFALALIVRTSRQIERVIAALDRAVGGQDEGRSTLNNLGQLDTAFAKALRAFECRISTLKAERADLLERSQFLQTVLSTMVEGVVAVDDSERMLFANESAGPLLDVDVDDLVGRSMLEVTRNAKVHALVRSALGGDELASVELEVGRSGVVVQVAVRRLPGDPCPGVVLIFHDISELRRLEKMRSEFVSNVSHELKTPLTSISAYADTLLEGAIDKPEHNRRFVERINEQADRLYELILDLLRLSSLESHATAVEAAPINVADCVQRCLEDHAVLAEGQSLELLVEPPPVAVQVMATKEGLRLILDNLLTNAIKFTPQGSVTVRWEPTNGHVRIIVKDTGLGIAMENQARVFERFFRSDSARTRDAGGTGLGLSIVKHTAQAFGGQVELESELGVGSQFAVLLPRANS